MSSDESYAENFAKSYDQMIKDFEAGSKNFLRKPVEEDYNGTIIANFHQLITFVQEQEIFGDYKNCLYNAIREFRATTFERRRLLYSTRNPDTPAFRVVNFLTTLLDNFNRGLGITDEDITYLIHVLDRTTFIRYKHII